MTRLNGKTAVITGGATGIGRAAAKRFIEEGAFVFIFGRRQEALDAAMADLGPNARAVKGSVSDEADLERLYAAVKAERGSLDIVFANAGAGGPLALGQIGDRALHRAGIGPEVGQSGVERFLPAAEDEDEGALLDEALCRCAADAGSAAGDHGGLSIQSGHVVNLSLVLHLAGGVLTCGQVCTFW